MDRFVNAVYDTMCIGLLHNNKREWLFKITESCADEQ